MEDSKIVELYWRKSTDAIKETDRKYGAYCFTIADNILHNKEDSEECVNDTWLNAWNAMPPRKPAKLQMFLAKIPRNLSFRPESNCEATVVAGKNLAAIDERMGSILLIL